MSTDVIQVPCLPSHTSPGSLKRSGSELRTETVPEVLFMLLDRFLVLVFKQCSTVTGVPNVYRCLAS